MIVGNFRSISKDCVCDSGREWCCSNKRKTGNARALSGYISAGADDPWGEPQTTTPAGEPSFSDALSSLFGGITAPFSSMASALAPAAPKPPKPSAFSSAVSSAADGLGKALVGGIQGAAQARTATTLVQQAAAQQAAKNKQMQMMVMVGVVGLGAFMLLRNRGGE